MATKHRLVFTDNSVMIKTITSYKNQGQRIVFTNGCFDLIHVGHVNYLNEAAQLGDRLIVGINSNDSVKRLKGSHRPIIDENDRAMVVASLGMVDAVVIFFEDTPLNLIKMILPDVLVKGGDWQIEQIVGSDIVLQNNGEVHSLTFYDGHSTTDIEHKIKHAT